MILYKYSDSVYNTLSECALKVSIPSQLNDPFECLLYNDGKWTEESLLDFLSKNKEGFYHQLKSFGIITNRQDFENGFEQHNKMMRLKINDILSERWFSNLLFQMKRKLDESLRIISLSSELCKASDEILLWSHYAGGHKGIRYRFDIGKIIKELNLHENSLRKVYYSEKRIGVDFTVEHPTSESAQEKITKSLHTKALGWQYEVEYRLMLSKYQCSIIKNSEGNFLEMFRFPASSLKRIDLGLNCNEILKSNIVEQLKRKDYGHIELYQATLHESDYSLKYRRMR